MALRSLLSNIARVAFKAAGDVPQAGTFRGSPTRTYTPETDTTATAWGITDSIAVILFDADLRVEIPGPVQDRKTGIVRLAQITGGAIKHGDQLEVGGILWNVFRAEPDPANATATLHLWCGIAEDAEEPSPASEITTEDGQTITTEDGQTITVE